MTCLKLHYHHHYHKHGYHRPSRLTLTSLIQVCCSYDCSSKNVHCCRVLEKFTCFLPPSSVELVHSLVKRVDRLDSQCSLLTNHVLMLQMVSDKLPVLAFACMLFFILGKCITQFSTVDQSSSMAPTTIPIQLTVSTSSCIWFICTKYSSVPEPVTIHCHVYCTECICLHYSASTASAARFSYSKYANICHCSSYSSDHTAVTTYSAMSSSAAIKQCFINRESSPT